MNRVSKKVCSILLLLFLMLPSGTVLAQEQGTPSPDDINRVAEGLYCPICDNVPLESCENAVCQQWRGEISRLLDLGWEDEAIREYFAEQYGAGVLAAPPASGWTLWVYIIPVGLLLAGLGIILRLYKRPQDDEEVPAEYMNVRANSYLHRVEDELARREKRVKL